MVKRVWFRQTFWVALCMMLVGGGLSSLLPALTTQAHGITIQIKQRNPVVNEGNQIRLTALDASGQPVSTVRWSSGSPDIAQVDVRTGEVQGIKQGFATVTAADGNVSASVFVVVARVRKGKGSAVPGDTKVDQSGALYLSNPLQNIILKASEALNSSVEVFAGKRGVRGLLNGNISQALFAGPTAIGIDNTVGGGLYVADTLNHSLRKITHTGEVETVLGTGSPGISPFDGDGIVPFEQVQFNGLRGVAGENGGNSFVADTDNHAIYYVDYARKTMLLLAGIPGEKGIQDGIGREARFSRPAGLALSNDGKILAVADQDNNRVRFLELMKTETGALICRVSTSGTGSRMGIFPNSESQEFEFHQPGSVSFDPVGNLVVADAVGVYVITRASGRSSEVVPLAQPEVSFGQAASVTVRGTTAYVLDAEAPTPETALNAVTVGAPEITTINQETVRSEGGQELVVTGKNFAPESLVVLGDAMATQVSVDSATQLRFIVPKQKLHGDRTLTIQTRGGVAQRRVTVVPKRFSDLTDGEITTLAGGLPYRGEGGKAREAVLSRFDVDLVMDATGNVLVTDPDGYQVRRIEVATSLITSVAGNGAPGQAQENVPAISTELDTPYSIAVDSLGNTYVLDLSRQTVHKVDAVTGSISTVAGGGTLDQEGILATQLNYAGREIAIDRSDNLYLGYGRGTIRRVDAQTGIVTRFAGNGTEAYSGDGGPALNAGFSVWDLKFDQSGNLFIADIRNQCIRRIEAQTGIITTVAGNGTAGYTGDGGPATQASLNSPVSIALDTSGNLFIADVKNFVIRRVDAQTGIITTFAGTDPSLPGGSYDDGTPALQAVLPGLAGLAVDGIGNVYFSNQGWSSEDGGFIRYVDAQTGKVQTLAGGGKLRPIAVATSAYLALSGLAVEDSGNIVLSDTRLQSVLRLDRRTGQLSTIAGGGNVEPKDNMPALDAFFLPMNGICLSPKGDLAIAEIGIIRKIDAQTTLIKRVAGNNRDGFSGDGGPARKAGISPRFIVYDQAGNLYISEVTRIRKIDAQTKIITTIAGTDEFGFSGDGGPATQASLFNPRQIAIDQQGNLFIADSGNHCIRRIDARTGIITTVAGTGRMYGFGGDGGPATEASFNSPEGIALDQAGNLYISDSTNHRIRRVDATTGIITTIAGTGEEGWEGDGDSALNAKINPDLLVFDQTGNLFVIDRDDYRFNGLRVIKGIGR